MFAGREMSETIFDSPLYPIKLIKNPLDPLEPPTIVNILFSTDLKCYQISIFKMTGKVNTERAGPARLHVLSNIQGKISDCWKNV